jgi:hypothetical protein
VSLVRKIGQETNRSCFPSTNSCETVKCHPAGLVTERKLCYGHVLCQ